MVEFTETEKQYISEQLAAYNNRCWAATVLSPNYKQFRDDFSRVYSEIMARREANAALKTHTGKTYPPNTVDYNEKTN